MGDLERNYWALGVRFYNVVKFINQFQETSDKYFPLKKTKEFEDTYLNESMGLKNIFLILTNLTFLFNII